MNVVNFVQEGINLLRLGRLGDAGQQQGAQHVRGRELMLQSLLNKFYGGDLIRTVLLPCCVVEVFGLLQEQHQWLPVVRVWFILSFIAKKAQNHNGYFRFFPISRMAEEQREIDA